MGQHVGRSQQANDQDDPLSGTMRRAYTGAETASGVILDSLDAAVHDCVNVRLQAI